MNRYKRYCTSAWRRFQRRQPLNIVPAINHLEELDPTHMVFPYQRDMDPAYHQCGLLVDSDEDIQWPVYEEALGG